MLAKAGASTTTTNETDTAIQPLLDDVQDFSEVEVARKRFEALQLRSSNYANLTFEDGRQFFEEVKSEYEDIPASMTFEEALAKNLLPERKKRSLLVDMPVSEDEAYHASLKGKGENLADLIKLENLRNAMIQVTKDLSTRELDFYLAEFKKPNSAGFYNYPLQVSDSTDRESLRQLMISAISHWTHFQLNEVQKKIDDEIDQIKRVKRSSRVRNFFQKPQCQTQVPTISPAPLIFIAVASSLGLLASLLVCCKTFCFKN